MSDSLQPQGLQNTRLLCPPLSPSLLKLLSTHLILCCPLLILLSIFPIIRVFSNALFTSGGQSIGASASVLPMNIQGWFPLGLTGLISLQSKRLSSIFPRTTVRKHQFFGTPPSLWSEFHVYMITGKSTALTIWTFVGKMMPLLFNMLSRFVIAFLPTPILLLFMEEMTKALK